LRLVLTQLSTPSVIPSEYFYVVFYAALNII